jgi:GNAT superfamily N-acetyltransferase
MIARAGLSDIPAIVPLFDAYRRFFAGYANLDESKRFLEERFSHEESVVLIARAGDDVVGFIQLYPLWSSWYCRRLWFLSDLYVAEASRKRGVGRQLVERAIAHARQTEALNILVELPRREPHLEEFYRRLGFKRDEVFDIARYYVETLSAGKA